MTDKAADYSAFQEGPSPDDLHKLAELAKAMFEAEAEVERVAEELKTKKATLKGIAERDIPELMQKVGMVDFTTTTGLKLKVAQILRASVSKANMAKAVAWLDKHGHGGLVKRKVFLDFTREQEEAAAKLADDLRKKGFENVSTAYTIHPQTLGAWVRERRANGEATPDKLLGVSEFSIAKVSTK